jgi:hypothetical protein
MPTYSNFDTREKSIMTQVVHRAGEALASALAAYIQDDQRFRTKFKTWFGKTTPAAIEDVRTTLTLMNGELEHDNYSIALGAASGNENANVLHFTRVYLHGRSPVGAIWQANKDNAADKKSAPLPMTIRPKLLTMPLIDQTQQSQVETFLHELSHFAAGVIDYSPPNCYDVVGTTYCSNQSVDVAVRNAENVGFFVQSFLYN